MIMKIAILLTSDSQEMVTQDLVSKQMGSFSTQASAGWEFLLKHSFKDVTWVAQLKEWELAYGVTGNSNIANFCIKIFNWILGQYLGQGGLDLTNWVTIYCLGKNLNPITNGVRCDSLSNGRIINYVWCSGEEFSSLLFYTRFQQIPCFGFNYRNTGKVESRRRYRCAQ